MPMIRYAWVIRSPNTFTEAIFRLDGKGLLQSLIPRLRTPASTAQFGMDMNLYQLHDNYQDLFTASWNGDENNVSTEYRQLIQNWRDGNYPIGGIPEIDENGIADVSYMADAGYIIVASERKFNAQRDYLWPVPDADRLINENLDQNPNGNRPNPKNIL